MVKNRCTQINILNTKEPILIEAYAYSIILYSKEIQLSGNNFTLNDLL